MGPLFLMGGEAQAVTAKVVAMDQVIIYNRLGAFNPAGMIFALARDVFPKGTLPEDETFGNSCASGGCSPGDVQLRSTKRPRPLTLRVHENETLTIDFTNLLNNPDIVDAQNEAAGIQLCEENDGDPRPGICESEQPRTRNVGIHIHGMQWVNPGGADDGSKVGTSAGSLVAPGGSTTYTYFAEKEGAYTITSGPNLGGEGGSGAIASGLFGVLNVEPAGSEWYRSQVTREEMEMAKIGETPGGQPILDYGANYPGEVNTTSTTAVSLGEDIEVTPDDMSNIRIGSVLTVDAGPASETVRVKSVTATTFTADFTLDHTLPFDISAEAHPYAGKPILEILDGSEIFHSDLNAVIDGPMSNDLLPTQVYPNRGEPFREYTVAFHDEIKVVQAFPGWFDALPFTLGSVKDGFAINYGTGGIGSEIIGNRLGVGPMHECVECKYEEFFLTSWTVGDPAMIVDVPANAGLEALKPGNTPNPVDVGPKATRAFYPDDPSNVWHGYLNDRTKIRNIHVGTEHHIFHLHAHQWLFASLDDNSNYVDAQALGPGSSFTYEIAYGGGGNRNKTAGDSIFHCHFYPHFAQGMWGLWRVHDTFEMGSVMNADGTVAERGLLDGEITGGGYQTNGTPIAGGTPIPGVVPIPTKAMAPMPGTFVADTDSDNVPDTPFMGYPFYIAGTAGHRPPTPPMDLVADGGIPRHVITGGTAHAVQTPTNFEKELLTADGYQLPEGGTDEEKAAMAFHGPQPGVYHASYTPENASAGFEVNGRPPIAGAPYADPCRADAYDGGIPGNPIGNPRTYQASVIELDVDLNKVGWHFGQQRIIVLDGDVADTMAGVRAPEPFVMRANSRDCVDFDHTNLVPNVYQLDDFQVKTPTDVIGQHIHLVKFDVMSADGAANGWNYEDGTLSPDETAERIAALSAGSWIGDDLSGGGPRTTRQRWYIDPGWSGNVFTHDHYGPSTHQQAGLYATLLVEPEGSSWKDPVTGIAMGSRPDGGPTSWRADIITTDDSWREFYLEFADFQLAYRGPQGDGAGFLNGSGKPVNPSDRIEVGLPDILLPAANPRPEAISSEDPGTFVVNYRNEPLALRVRDPNTNTQASGRAGDLSFAFSSRVRDRADARLNAKPGDWPYGIQTATIGAVKGDPFTPLLRAYEGDKVYLRIQVGAHEEGHNFSMNGIRWLQQWNSGYSGFRNSQMAGISEYFIFRVPAVSDVQADTEDFMYQTGSSVDARWNGTWGIMRAYKGLQSDLKPLPSNPDGIIPTPKGKSEFQGPCPSAVAGQNARQYEVWAVKAEDVLPGGAIEYKPGNLKDPTGLLYVLEDDIDPITGQFKADRRVEPLILRAAAGECVEVKLVNKLLQQAVDANGNPVYDGDGNEVFVDEGQLLYTDQLGLVAAVPPIMWDEIPDLDGFNLLPMIVNQFNGNDVTPSREVGLHAQLVEYDMFDSDGMNVGLNQDQTAAPGEAKKYTWYAGRVDIDPETGKRTAEPVEYGAINLMASDPIEGSSKGLIGALIIEPQGTTWNDGSVTGKGKNKVAKPDGEPDENGKLSRAAVTVTCEASEGCGYLANGESFRDFVVIMQDDVNMRFADDSPVPIISEEEEPEDSGMKAINYRTDPIWQRLGIGPTADEEVTRTKDFTNAFAGTPVTPIFKANKGDEVRFRVLKPGGHNRNHVFTLHGHLWARHPFNNGSTAIDPWNDHTFWHGEQMGHGPTNHINVVPLNGAGGTSMVAGEYLYRDMVPVHVYNGIWGIFKVE
jgi:hypothetical protein